jgi:hypothetical protein
VQDLGGVAISFPHSTEIFSNELRGVDMLNRPQGYVSHARMLEYFNYLVVCSSTERNLVAGAVTDPMHLDKIRIIGSLRYSRRWMKLRDELMPTRKYEFPRKEPWALKIVLLCPKRSVNIFWEELIRVVRIIASFSDHAICIKGPAQGDQAYVTEFRRMGLDNLDVVAMEYDTSAVIDWADVVFWVDTTVFYEALLKDKPIVHLKFLWINTMFVDGHPAMWQAVCRDDMYTILDRWRENKHYRPYTDEEVDDLLHRTANSVQGDVFSDAVDLIRKAAERPTSKLSKRCSAQEILVKEVRIG